LGGEAPFWNRRNVRPEHDGTKVNYMFVYQLCTLQKCALMMFGWFASVTAIHRCWLNSVISALHDCAISKQANAMRFTPTVLTNSGGKRKVGAQTCNFYPLVLLCSKVMSFRIHAPILLISWGEDEFREQCNFWTEHDERKLVYKSVIQLFTQKTSALIMSGWFATVLVFSASSSSQVRSPPPDCFPSARTLHRGRVWQNQLHFRTPTLSCPSGWQAAKQQFEARFE
jgi:hypothetical protein